MIASRSLFEIPGNNAGELIKMARNVLQSTHYKLIENPELFKKQYKKLTRENGLLFDFGVFDTACISPPKAIENKLVFYVRDPHNIPLMATFDPLNKHMAIKTLPYEQSCS